MTTQYPTAIDNKTKPTASQETTLPLDATYGNGHAALHQMEVDSIQAIQAKVGIDSSTVNTSHDFKLSEVATGEKAVSKTATQTLTNKTLTSPAINGGTLTSITTAGTNSIAGTNTFSGTNNLSGTNTVTGATTFNSSLPTSTQTPTNNADLTTKVYVDGKAVADQTGNSGKFLTTNGTNTSWASISGQVYKNGIASKNAADASETQNIAHGLGKIPTVVKITAHAGAGGASSGDQNLYIAHTVYNGTTQSSISTYGKGSSPYFIDAQTFSLNSSTVSSGAQTGVVTFDATNIIITWTKNDAPSGTFNLLWEAIA